MVCDCNVPGVCPQPEITLSCPAKVMEPRQRQDLALQALAGTDTISGLAAHHEVSRKFVYQQAAKGEEALQEAFSPEEPGEERILFHLPVTKAWLRQMVLGLTLICHSSIRGVGELFRDVFDYPISVGTVHAILLDAVEQARSYNRWQDLTFPAAAMSFMRCAPSSRWPRSWKTGPTGPSAPTPTWSERWPARVAAEDAPKFWPANATPHAKLKPRPSPWPPMWPC